MTHRFPIKEIARQSGLGPATVDRVLNGRAHVSPQARARVEAAVAELTAQEAQLAAKGHRLFVDVVMEAPQRFTRQVRRACEAALPEVSEAVFRPRFHLGEVMSDNDFAQLAALIRKRGSHGVILKARDTPVVRDAVDRLADHRVPVVALVTDLPGTRRCAYVGVDNIQAGRTAAYLLARLLDRDGTAVLTSRSRDTFQGETARYDAFQRLFRALRPEAEIIEIGDAGGLAPETLRRIAEMPLDHAVIGGVYSMGGGNRAILDGLRQRGQAPRHFIAHDLDTDNRELLAAGEIDFVLHHDLKLDMRRALRALSAEHGLAPRGDVLQFSDVQIITPENVPVP